MDCPFSETCNTIHVEQVMANAVATFFVSEDVGISQWLRVITCNQKRDVGVGAQLFGQGLSSLSPWWNLHPALSSPFPSSPGIGQTKELNGAKQEICAYAEQLIYLEYLHSNRSTTVHHSGCLHPNTKLAKKME